MFNFNVITNVFTSKIQTLQLRKMPFINDAYVYILRDMLQCNTINVIFVNGNNVNFYSQLVPKSAIYLLSYGQT